MAPLRFCLGWQRKPSRSIWAAFLISWDWKVAMLQPFALWKFLAFLRRGQIRFDQKESRLCRGTRSLRQSSRRRITPLPVSTAMRGLASSDVNHLTAVAANRINEPRRHGDTEAQRNDSNTAKIK